MRNICWKMNCKSMGLVFWVFWVFFFFFFFFFFFVFFYIFVHFIHFKLLYSNFNWIKLNQCEGIISCNRDSASGAASYTGPNFTPSHPQHRVTLLARWMSCLVAYCCILWNIPHITTATMLTTAGRDCPPVLRCGSEDYAGLGTTASSYQHVHGHRVTSSCLLLQRWSFLWACSFECMHLLEYSIEYHFFRGPLSWLTSLSLYLLEQLHCRSWAMGRSNLLSGVCVIF